MTFFKRFRAPAPANGDGARAPAHERASTAAPAGDVDVMIRAEGLEKVYRTGDIEVPALTGVDLVIRRGEMVAIMGPSGCGKTTLLNCLSGLDEPSAGRVLIGGDDLHAMGDDARTRYRARHMGFIFQSFNLLPVLSAEENVELPLLVAGVPPADARERALEALARVGLADRARHKPPELSGGQQQRVTIARSLVNDPFIVWADEPTGNLDTRTGLEILELMKELNASHGQTYVIVTHDPRLAAECHRVLHMENGALEREERQTARARG